MYFKAPTQRISCLQNHLRTPIKECIPITKHFNPRTTRRYTMTSGAKKSTCSKFERYLYFIRRIQNFPIALLGFPFTSTVFYDNCSLLLAAIGAEISDPRGNIIKNVHCSYWEMSIGNSTPGATPNRTNILWSRRIWHDRWPTGLGQGYRGGREVSQVTGQ